MGVEKDDLGLSLSLSYPHSSQASQLGLSPFGFSLHKHSQRERETFASLDRISEAEARPFLRGIDVNRPPPSTADCEEQEEAGASSPNSTISSVSGKRGEREMVSGGEDNEAERDCSRGGGGSDEEDGENSRKKLRLSKDQSAVLEESFREHNTLNPDQVEADGDRLRVPEEVLREPDGGEPAAAEGGPGAARPQALPSVLHAHAPSHHPHHVPLLRAPRAAAHLFLRRRRLQALRPPPGARAYDPMGRAGRPRTRDPGRAVAEEDIFRSTREDVLKPF
ncbi:homeobox-leucine zipper protein HAT4-like isoform X2 [Rhodamnia argentea]|uniref:Homeobox-leucine zipper protein HAT4-like isoform X2 n=1 Tax=Rhodamnia argentea TaxID=178133 RepID=A0ABM3HXN8_9MYRT|nr:homeobox-leucine zipper protein HAT4-like isoform X2 [Rhodamnia argentea]